MSEIYSGRCLCGAVRFEAKGPAEVGAMVSLRELPQAQRSTCERLRVLRESSGYRRRRSHCGIQLVAGSEPRLLRPMRLHVDLQQRETANRDALLRGRV
jgi:hypothetical protein